MLRFHHHRLHEFLPNLILSERLILLLVHIIKACVTVLPVLQYRVHVGIFHLFLENLWSQTFHYKAGQLVINHFLGVFRWLQLVVFVLFAI